MKCYVATKNPKKIEVAQKVLSEYFSEIQVIGCSASSGVSETPWDKDTVIGSKNRAINSIKENADADLGMGIETGLTEKQGKIFEETWCCIMDKIGHEFLGYASSNVVEVSDNTKVVLDDSGSKRLEGFEGDPEVREISLLTSIKITTLLLKKQNRY